MGEPFPIDRRFSADVLTPGKRNRRGMPGKKPSVQRPTAVSTDFYIEPFRPPPEAAAAEKDVIYALESSGEGKTYIPLPQENESYGYWAIFDYYTKFYSYCKDNRGKLKNRSKIPTGIGVSLRRKLMTVKTPPEHSCVQLPPWQYSEIIKPLMVDNAQIVLFYFDRILAIMRSKSKTGCLPVSRQKR